MCSADSSASAPISGSHDTDHHGLAGVVTTHDLNGIATHLPNLVCLNTEVIAAGPQRPVITAEPADA